MFGSIDTVVNKLHQDLGRSKSKLKVDKIRGRGVYLRKENGRILVSFDRGVFYQGDKGLVLARMEGGYLMERHSGPRVASLNQKDFDLLGYLLNKINYQIR